MKGDLVTRLLLETQQFDQNLTKATQQVRGFTATGNGASSMLGGLGGMLGKVAGAVGVTMTAMEAFNKTIESSQTLTDAFGQICMQASTSVDYFFSCLANGDFSSFINGLNTVIQTAKDAYNAIDALSTFSIFDKAKRSQFNLRQSQITNVLRNPKSTEAQKAEARRQQDQLNKERQQWALRNSQTSMNAFKATFNNNLAKNGALGWFNTIIKGVTEKGLDYYNWSNKRFEELDKLRSAEYAKAARNGYRFGTIPWKYEDEWRARKALKETGDEDLQASFQYLAQAYDAQAEAINQETSGYRAYYKGLGGKGVKKATVGTPHQQQVEAKSALQQIVEEINEITKKRDYMLQLGVNTDQAKKDIDELKKQINNKQLDLLNIGVNLIANGASASQMQDYINVLKQQQQNSTDQSSYNYWQTYIELFGDYIKRLTGEFKNLIPALEKFSGSFSGGKEDLSSLDARLAEVRKFYDDLDRQILEETAKLKLPSDLTYQQMMNRKVVIYENENDPVYDQYLKQLNEEEAYKEKFGTYPYVGGNTELINQLQSRQKGYLDAINSLEAIRYNIKKNALDSSSIFNYRKSPVEILASELEWQQRELKKNSATLHTAIANPDKEGKSEPFALQMTIPPQNKEDIKRELENVANGNKSDYPLLNMLSVEQAKQGLAQLKEDALEISDITINLDFDKQSVDKLEEITKEIDSSLNEVERNQVLVEISKDIENYANSVSELRKDAVFEGINSIVSLTSAWKSLAETLGNSNADIFDKIAATIETIVSTFSKIDNFIETINNITSMVKKLSEAWDSHNSIFDSIFGSADQAVQMTTKTAAETAAHTANATAMGAETASMATLSAAQGATIATTTALYLAAKKAAAAQIFLAHSYIPFAGVGIASGMVATMEGVLASLAAFANGGIVGGNSYTGDKVLARLNSGEMVLNRTQQGNLFGLLSEGGNSSSNVVFTVRGRDLVGVLNNYNDKMSKIQ